MSLELASPRYGKGKINFGPIFNAPFVRGFFGRMHYPMYALYFLGLTWKDTGFAAKTITLERHEGNVDADKNGTVWWVRVKAIYYSFPKNCFVNAVGLTNPGLQRCLELGRWRKMEQPFVISLTSIAHDRQTRIREADVMAKRLCKAIDFFQAPVAIQWNVDCPNEGVYKDMTGNELTQEIMLIFAALGVVKVPLILSCSALMPLEVIREVSDHVDAFWIGNSVPVGHPSIDWKKLFKGGISPLIRRGMKIGGGYSGPEGLMLTRKKVEEIRAAGIDKPIVAGHGIREPWDVQRLRDAGANAVFIGSIVVQPWKMRAVIDAARNYHKQLN